MASTFYFLSQYRNLRDNYPKRVEELKEWNWSDVSEDLRDLTKEVLEATLNRVEFDEEEGLEGDFEEAVATTIHLDFGPEDTEKVIDGVQNTREPSDLFAKLKRQYFILTILCGVMAVVSLGVAYVLVSDDLRMPGDITTWAFIYSYPILAIASFSLHAYSRRSRLQDLWEDYRRG